MAIATINNDRISIYSFIVLLANNSPSEYTTAYIITKLSKNAESIETSLAYSVIFLLIFVRD